MAKNTTADIPFETTNKSDSKIMTVPVKGDAVSRYAQACDEIEKAEAVKIELAPVLQEAGLKAVFGHNMEVAALPKQMISSINLVDKAKEEEDQDKVDRVMFTWTRKDLKNDPNAVKALFATLAAQRGVKKAEQGNYWQQYCEEVVSAKFDSKVFNDGNGKFDRARYDKFVKALEAVCKELKCPMPLTPTKVIAPKEDFHDRRFQDFDMDTNMLLLGVLPNQTALKTIRAVAQAEEK